MMTAAWIIFLLCSSWIFLIESAYVHKNTVLWPNGVIPFHIDRRIAVPDRLHLEFAMKTIHRITNSAIRFQNVADPEPFQRIEWSWGRFWKGSLLPSPYLLVVPARQGVKTSSSTAGVRNVGARMKNFLFVGKDFSENVALRELVHILGLEREANRHELVTTKQASKGHWRQMLRPKNWPRLFTSPKKYTVLSERNNVFRGWPYDPDSITNYKERGNTLKQQGSSSKEMVEWLLHRSSFVQNLSAMDQEALRLLYANQYGQPKQRLVPRRYLQFLQNIELLFHHAKDKMKVTLKKPEKIWL